ncbi:MAG: [FeFe] hydrogenase H-cluster radical SAM maturase HydG, partial [Thermodesulfobacteriota bacterium]
MLIDTQRIASLANESSTPTRAEVDGIIEKAQKLRGLELEEAAMLLRAEGPGLHQLIKTGAAKVKERIFGSRVVFF